MSNSAENVLEPQESSSIGRRKKRDRSKKKSAATDIQDDIIHDIIKILTSYSATCVEKEVVDVSFWSFKLHWREASAYLLHNCHQQKGDIRTLKNPLFDAVLKLLHMPSFMLDDFPCSINQLFVTSMDLWTMPGYLLQALWNIEILYVLYCVYSTQNLADNYSPIYVTIDQMIELRLAMDRISLLGQVLSQDAIKLYKFLLDSNAFAIFEDYSASSISGQVSSLGSIDVSCLDELDADPNIQLVEKYSDYVSFRLSDAYCKSDGSMLGRLDSLSWVHDRRIILHQTNKFKLTNRSVTIQLYLDRLKSAYRQTLSSETTLVTESIINQPSLKLHDLRDSSKESKSQMNSQMKLERKQSRLKSRYEKFLGPMLTSVEAIDQYENFAETQKALNFLVLLERQTAQILNETLDGCSSSSSENEEVNYYQMSSSSTNLDNHGLSLGERNIPVATKRRKVSTSSVEDSNKLTSEAVPKSSDVSGQVEKSPRPKEKLARSRKRNALYELEKQLADFDSA
jgi:hypothetical protein